MDMTVDFETGERASTMNCYLRRKRYPEIRENVEIKTECLVSGLIFEGEEGNNSTSSNQSNNTVVKGVRVVRANNLGDAAGNQLFEDIIAEREVILCAGAVGTVQILQSAGIGDAEFLMKELGYSSSQIRANLPDVGNNLEDHLEFYLQYRCTEPISLYPYAATYDLANAIPGMSSLSNIGPDAFVKNLNKLSPYAFRNPLSVVKTGLEWFTTGSGLTSSNQFEVGGFIRSNKNDASIQHPDIQFHFIPGIVVGQSDFLPAHGYQAHVGTLRPTSRGSIKIQKALHEDPYQNQSSSKPLIDPNFLDTQKDIEDQRRAFKLGVEIMESQSFQKYNGGRYNFSNSIDNSQFNPSSDKEIDSWIRQNTHSGYHLSCTCKMGKVVCPKTAKVYGVENLRIIDASVMPSMTSGNLNAPTIMLAEKLVHEGVLGLEPERLPEGIDEEDLENLWWKADWKEKQRERERT